MAAKKPLSEKAHQQRIRAAHTIGVGNPHYGDEERAAISKARHMGARRLDEIISLQLQVAILGYDTVTDPDTNRTRREPADSDTRQVARRFIADRCGLAVKAETELSGEVAGLPLTLIVTGEEVAEQ